MKQWRDGTLTTDLDDADRDALERAMEIARRDPGRAEQLRAMLEDDEWVEVAEFFSYSLQIQSLSLKPWQSPPCHIDENADAPDDADCEPNTVGRKLLRQMLRAGISRFDPDPLAALRRVKRRR